MLVSMPPTLLDCTLAITPITCGGTFMPAQKTSSAHAHTLCHVKKARRQSVPWRGPYSCPPAILNDEELLSSGAAASGAFKSLPASMSPLRRHGRCRRNGRCRVTGPRPEVCNKPRERTKKNAPSAQQKWFRGYLNTRFSGSGARAAPKCSLCGRSRAVRRRAAPCSAPCPAQPAVRGELRLSSVLVSSVLVGVYT